VNDSRSTQPAIHLRQFRSGCCWSYVLWDRAPGACIVVDPCVELMSDYRAFIAERGLKVVMAVDTQLHPDRLSATHLFHAEYGAPIAMSEATSSQRVHHKLKDGEEIELGSSKLQALGTPGIAPDGISIASSSWVLTGHLLPVGGRASVYSGTDFPELVRSWNEVLVKLPDATLIFPGRDSGDLLFSTVGTEKAKNRYLRLRSPEELRSLIFDQPEIPRLGSAADQEACLAFNREVAPQVIPLLDPATDASAPNTNSIPSISVAKLVKKLGKASTEALIDIREPDDFATGWISSSLNIPLSELPFRYQELKRFNRVYVASLSGSRGDWRGPATVRTLAYLGLPDVIAVEGGVRGWIQFGYPLEGAKSR